MLLFCGCTLRAAANDPHFTAIETSQHTELKRNAQISEHEPVQLLRCYLISTYKSWGASVNGFRPKRRQLIPECGGKSLNASPSLFPPPGLHLIPPRPAEMYHQLFEPFFFFKHSFKSQHGNNGNPELREPVNVSGGWAVIFLGGFLEKEERIFGNEKCRV